jgi:epoxyqueuosine reductase QueG
MLEETAREDPLSDTALTKLCRAAGADDVGFVDLDREALAGQRESVLRYLPWVRSLVIVVRSLDRPTVRARLRSLSSAEFVAVGQEVEAIIDRVVKDLAGNGVRALGFYCFPAEFGGQDGSPSAVSLRLLAEAAGLGVIGKNRLVLHPRFGADIYLGAIAIDRTLTAYGQPLTSSPCLTCNLCDETCPTGAIGKDGYYDQGSCIQSRGYDANIHCDLCRAVCPAGDEVIGLQPAGEMFGECGQTAVSS